MSSSKGKLFDKFRKPFRSHTRSTSEGRGDQFKPPAATSAGATGAASGVKRSQSTRVTGSAPSAPLDPLPTKPAANTTGSVTKSPSTSKRAALASASAPTSPQQQRGGAPVASADASAAANAAAHHAGAAGIDAHVGTADEARAATQATQATSQLQQSPQQQLPHQHQKHSHHQQQQQQPRSAPQQAHAQQVPVQQAPVQSQPVPVQSQHHQTLDPSKSREHRLSPTDSQAENASTRAMYGGDSVRGVSPAPGNVPGSTQSASASASTQAAQTGVGKTSAASSIPATSTTPRAHQPSSPLVSSYTAGEYATTSSGNTYKQTPNEAVAATSAASNTSKSPGTTPKRHSSRKSQGTEGSTHSTEAMGAFRQPSVKRDVHSNADERYVDPLSHSPGHKRTHSSLAPDDAPVPANEVGAMGRKPSGKAVGAGAAVGAATGAAIGSSHHRSASGSSSHHRHQRTPSAASANSPSSKRRASTKSDDSNVSPYARDPKAVIMANLEEAKRGNNNNNRSSLSHQQPSESTALFESSHDKDPSSDVIVSVQGTKDNSEATKIAQRAVEQLKRENPELLKLSRELRINFVTGDVTDQYGQTISKVDGYGGFIENRGHQRQAEEQPTEPAQYSGKVAEKAGTVNAPTGVPLEALGGHSQFYNDDVDHSPTPPHLDKTDKNLSNNIPASSVIGSAISGGYYAQKPIQHRPSGGVADIVMSEGATRHIRTGNSAATGSGSAASAIRTQVPATGRDMGWPNSGVFVDHMMNDEDRQAGRDAGDDVAVDRAGQTPHLSSIGAAGGAGTAADYSEVVADAFKKEHLDSSNTHSHEASQQNRDVSGGDVGVHRAASYGSRTAKAPAPAPDAHNHHQNQHSQHSQQSQQPSSLAPPKHTHRRAASRDFDVDAIRHGAPQETPVSRHVMNREPSNVQIPQSKSVSHNQEDFDASVPYAGSIGVAHDVGTRPVRASQIPPHSPRLDLGPGPHSPVPTSPVPMSPKAAQSFGFSDEGDEYGNPTGGHSRGTSAIIGALGAAGVVGATRKPSTKRSRPADGDSNRASTASQPPSQGHRHTHSSGSSKAIFPSSETTTTGNTASSSADAEYPIAGEFAGIGREQGPVNKHLSGAVVNPTPPVNPDLANSDDTIDQKVSSRSPPPRSNLGEVSTSRNYTSETPGKPATAGAPTASRNVDGGIDGGNDASRLSGRDDAIAALESGHHSHPVPQPQRFEAVAVEKERVSKTPNEAREAKFVSGAILSENPANLPSGVIEPEPSPTAETPSSPFAPTRDAYRNMSGGYEDSAPSPSQASRALKGSPQAYKRASMAYDDDLPPPAQPGFGSGFRNYSSSSGYPESTSDYPRLSDFSEPTDYSEPDFARPNYSKTNYSEPSFSEPELEPETEVLKQSCSRDDYLPQGTYPVSGAAAGAVTGGAIAGIGGAAVGAIAGAALGSKAGGYAHDDDDAVVRDNSPAAYDPSTNYDATESDFKQANHVKESVIGEGFNQGGQSKALGGNSDEYPLESFIRGPRSTTNDHSGSGDGFQQKSASPGLAGHAPRENLFSDVRGYNEPIDQSSGNTDSKPSVGDYTESSKQIGGESPSDRTNQFVQEHYQHHAHGDQPSETLGDHQSKQRSAHDHVHSADSSFDKYRQSDTPDRATPSEFGIDNGYGATGVVDDGYQNRNVSSSSTDPGKAFGAQLGQVVNKHRNYVEVDNSPSSAYTTPKANLDNIQNDEITAGFGNEFTATHSKKSPLDELIDNYSPQTNQTSHKPAEFSVDRAKVRSQSPAYPSFDTPRTTPRDTTLVESDDDEIDHDLDRGVSTNTRADALGGGAAAALAGTAIVGAHFGNSPGGHSQERYGEAVHEIPDFDDEPQLAPEEIARRRRDIEKRAASAGATIKGLNENKPYTPEELAQKKTQAIKARGYIGPRYTDAEKGTYIYHCDGIPVPGFWVD
ncbi:hypothetical protein DIRU0_D11430 [Diutina rugosa]